MRAALRRNSTRTQVARVVRLPPPTGGWNTRDAVSAMPAEDAIVLDNWLPDVNGLSIRKGYTTHATGIVAQTLMEYSPASGSSRLFAASATGIFDVTVAGAVGAAVVAATNARWSHTIFSTGAGGAVLYAANGADTPVYYDGAVWTGSTFTGVTLANLDTVLAHVSRLWLLEKNSANVWYAPTLALGGTLTKFPLQPFLRLGGKIIAMGTWTRDGGAGMDDHIVFVSNKGEVIIYAGTDPSTASTFRLVGVFRIPEPIGRRCIIKAGADLAVLTAQGLIPLSSMLATDTAGVAALAVTDKILGAFQTAYTSSRDNFGWQVIDYPRRGLLLINVPTTEGTGQVQFVINLRTGAACRFTGINAVCWGHLNGDLYFGAADGTVYKFDNGFLDGTANVIAMMQTAFSDLGVAGVRKSVRMAQPMIVGPPAYAPQIQVRTDYDTSRIAPAAVFGRDIGTAWDEAAWDVAEWAQDYAVEQPWQSVYGYGDTISVSIGASAESQLTYNGLNLMVETGGPM